MTYYELVFELIICKEIDELKGKATYHRYDGITSLRITHPNITDGAIGITAYGTGFWYQR